MNSKSLDVLGKRGSHGRYAGEKKLPASIHVAGKIMPARLPIMAGSLLAAGLACFAGDPAYGATTINWATPAVVADSGVQSTTGNSSITVSTTAGKWAVGDIIYFTGTSASTNPFGTAATRYYVVSASGNAIQVATTPGGTALKATNTTTASTTQQGQDWLTTTNWTGGTAPNSNTQIANFGSHMASGSVPAVVNGGVTAYGVTFGGSANGDLTMVSGANGTGLNALTFATNDSTTPMISLTAASNAIIALGTSSAGSLALKVAGSQGLIFNSFAGGAITGSGTSATSTAPGKQIRLANVDWSSFSGGLQVERGVVQLSASGQLPSQTLTVGDAQTLTNNLLAGLNLNSQTATTDALAGNNLGRVYGAGTLTVGNSNGSGSYGGVIGVDFTGASTATNLIKTGTGSETISGTLSGSGALTVNGGTIVLSNANSFSGGTTINSGGTVQIGNATALGSGTSTINSGGTLDVNGQTVSSALSVSGAGVGGAGALINSSSTPALISYEINNGANYTVGGSGDITIQRSRSGGGIFTVTKVGSGTLTLGNASATSHDNLLALDVESASTVNLGMTGSNIAVDRGVLINGGGIVRYTGSSTRELSLNNFVTVNNGTFDMNGLNNAGAALGTLTIGDGTNNGIIAGGSASNYTVAAGYTIEARSGSVNVNLGEASGAGVILNKTTSGSVTLSQTNTYTGATNISAGTLFVNGTNSGGGAYTVSGGTLAGGGAITTAGNAGVTVAAGGQLAPGAASGAFGTLAMNLGSGSLDISGAVAASDSQSMLFDLTGTGNDEIVLSNPSSSLDIGNGVLNFDDFAFNAAPDVTAGIYTLFDTSNTIAGTLGSNLSGTINGSLVGRLQLADGGHDIVLNVTAVPEPASFAAMALGSIGLLARRRRRTKMQA